jgi:hypothetical protein
LLIEDVVNGSSETGRVPEITRAPVVGPVSTTPNLRESTTKSARGISLEITKYALGPCITSYHRMHVRHSDVEGMRDPLPMRTDGPQCLERDLPSFPPNNQRRLFEMRSPPSLPERMRNQHGAAWNRVLRVNPTLFRAWQMRAICRER